MIDIYYKSDQYLMSTKTMDTLSSYKNNRYLL